MCSHTKREVSDLVTSLTWADVFSAVTCTGFVVAMLFALAVNVKKLCTLEGECCFTQGRVTGTMLHDTDIWEVSGHSPGYRDLQETELVAVCCVANAVLCLRKLLLSGDVEENPGPGPTPDPTPDHSKEDKEDNPHNTDTDTDTDAAGQKLTRDDGGIAPDVATEILRAIRMQGEQQEEQNCVVRHELSEIKTELGIVIENCQQINERCSQLESEQSRLSVAVESLTGDVGQLHDTTIEGREQTATLTTTVTGLQDQVTKMTDDIDRLESFSRRDNLRFFGVTQQVDDENYDTCAGAVVDTLNSVKTYKTWTDDDIVRAHRVGQARPGEPKPMIVKFRQWRDKMTLIKDKDIRGQLEEKGVRLANDLTRIQAETVAQAKREGKVAYFVRGKLTIQPRRLDQRTYADVTARGSGVVSEETRVSVDSASASRVPCHASADRQSAGGPAVRGDLPRRRDVTPRGSPSRERWSSRGGRDAVSSVDRSGASPGVSRDVTRGGMQSGGSQRGARAGGRPTDSPVDSGVGRGGQTNTERAPRRPSGVSGKQSGMRNFLTTRSADRTLRSNSKPT